MKPAITTAELREIACDFRAAPRRGAEKDDPEGSRYVLISDTLANRLAKLIDRIAGAFDGCN